MLFRVQSYYFFCELQNFLYLCAQIRVCVYIIKDMRLVFASNNAHKLQEVCHIMPAGIEVLSLREVGFEAEIEETGTTLAENSLIKAKTVYEWLRVHEEQVKGGCIDGVFADDTGLEIDALNGEPGVYTARWSGVQGNEKELFAANRAKALRELGGQVNRGAQFKTVISLIRGGDVLQVEGVVRGVITEEEKGIGGFGYDPIFQPEGYDCTFAEMSEAEKNGISHRGRALAKLVEKIERMNE